MMDVSFTTAFDFIRRGQSAYGGVFAYPAPFLPTGAKSLSLTWPTGPIKPLWVPTPISERTGRSPDLVLGCGYRVVYQRNAVVLTKIPTSYGGLRRMLLRWARSNVRENLAMISFLIKPFRTGHSGSAWIRLFSFTQLVRMALGEAFKVALMIQMVLCPLLTLVLICLGCFTAAILPGVVHQLRYGGWFGWRWAIPYSVFWLFGLSWISLWGLATAPRSGWLTRVIPSVREPSSPTPLIPPAGPSPRHAQGLGGV